MPPLSTTLTSIDKRLAVIELNAQYTRQDVKVVRDKVTMLNDWHLKVNGALMALGGVGSVLLALGLAILDKLVK